MNKISIQVLLVGLLISVASVRCSTGSNLLKADSQLLSSLANVPSLSTFTNLLKTPGLDKFLGDVLKNPFTMLAPTNDAMNSLDSSVLSNLANPANVSQVANFLKDHIIKGRLGASNLMQSGLKAVSGKAIDLGGVQLGNMISGDKFNAFPIDKILGG